MTRLSAPLPGARSSAARHTVVRARIAALCALVCAAAPLGAQTGTTSTAQPSTAELTALFKARTDSARRDYSAADVQFMTHMIGHHGQALIMAGWAKSHGASPSVQTLCDRIINAQHDEITTMQNWLRDRGLPVPDPNAMSGMNMGSSMGSNMPGMSNMAGMNMSSNMSGGALMPGMLTAEQMRALDAARGPEFDRLFLSGMIQHHRGALTMVKALFDSYGAAQDDWMFKFASDINVDQTTEIARMEKMLAALPPSPSATPRS